MMRRKNLVGLLCSVVAGYAGNAFSAGNLENPAENSTQSGIGVFSGWYCEAESIEIVFDDRAPKLAAYGTDRLDTEAACGDRDNGFSLLWYYGLLGEGQHRVRAYADGVKFADKIFDVGIINNGDFLRGVEAEYTLSDFPEDGTNTRITWSESSQNFAIKESFQDDSLDGTYELYRMSIQWNDESILDSEQSNVSATGAFTIDGTSAFQSIFLIIDGEEVRSEGSFDIVDNGYYLSVVGASDVVIVDRGERLITMRHLSDSQNDFAEVDYWRRTDAVASAVKYTQHKAEKNAKSNAFGGLAIEVIKKTYDESRLPVDMETP